MMHECTLIHEIILAHADINMHTTSYILLHYYVLCIQTNNRKTHVLNGNSEEVFWKNLRVGNIILVRNSSPLPADIILLATSEEENICYVETSQIDGETNLKLHRYDNS